MEWEAEEMAEVQLEDYDDIDAYYAARLEAWREEDRAEGQRMLLRRQAAMKFDARTAADVAELLDGVTEQEVFDAVLAAIFECDSPAGVLERAAAACRHENGLDVPADG